MTTCHHLILSAKSHGVCLCAWQAFIKPASFLQVGKQYECAVHKATRKSKCSVMLTPCNSPQCPDPTYIPAELRPVMWECLK